MKKYFYILLLSVFFLSACDDYLTKEIEFEDIGYKPQMSITAPLTNLSDTLFISASKSINFSVTTTNQIELIDNASFILKNEKGETWKSVAFDGVQAGRDKRFFNYYIVLKDVKKQNLRFTLEGTHPDYPSISSSILMPSGSEPTDMKFFKKDRVKTTSIGQKVIQDRVEFTLEDDGDTENYYAVSLERVLLGDTTIVNMDTIIKVSFPFLTEVEMAYPGAVELKNAKVVLLKNDSFNGKTAKFTLYANTISHLNQKSHYYLVLSRISKSKYYFLESYDRYNKARNFGLFAEPTTLYDNIEGGLGLFSGEDVYRIKLEE